MISRPKPKIADNKDANITTNAELAMERRPVDFTAASGLPTESVSKGYVRPNVSDHDKAELRTTFTIVVKRDLPTYAIGCSRAIVRRNPMQIRSSATADVFAGGRDGTATTEYRDQL
jgi:hypothetical protein